MFGYSSRTNHCIKLTMSSERIAQQGYGVPPELVRDYEVILKRNGEVVAYRAVLGNYQRLNVLDFEPVLCDTIEIRIAATNGYEDVRIYEVRAY